MNFCVAILISKKEEDIQRFHHIMPYYFKKGKNANEMQKKIVQYMERVLWLIKCVKSDVQSFLGLLTFCQIIICCGAVLCFERYLAVPLASTR